ncbi:hypothetical protein PCANC_09669 [Puccinia coronata f. sp. avenae]|uniref:Uncharacterized protein n=1 Tax=Puccinia coronata f. sp. avenae TaxID=200324 RepID=A0A2N5SVP7_9BASI|nr:hypothetical protein PCANC_14137 [Puccinia coronata f. sp. avenae]PLW47086.1 hypothetical protein PCANC_09669 [Puccinia coronata f. sp. avenae]
MNTPESLSHAGKSGTAELSDTKKIPQSLNPFDEDPITDVRPTSDSSHSESSASSRSEEAAPLLRDQRAAEVTPPKPVESAPKPNPKLPASSTDKPKNKDAKGEEKKDASIRKTVQKMLIDWYYDHSFVARILRGLATYFNPNKLKNLKKEEESKDAAKVAKSGEKPDESAAKSKDSKSAKGGKSGESWLSKNSFVARTWRRVAAYFDPKKLKKNEKKAQAAVGQDASKAGTSGDKSEPSSGPKSVGDAKAPKSSDAKASKAGGKSGTEVTGVTPEAQQSWTSNKSFMARFWRFLKNYFSWKKLQTKDKDVKLKEATKLKEKPGEKVVLTPKLEETLKPSKADQSGAELKASPPPAAAEPVQATKKESKSDPATATQATSDKASQSETKDSKKKKKKAKGKDGSDSDDSDDESEAAVIRTLNKNGPHPYARPHDGGSGFGGHEHHPSSHAGDEQEHHSDGGDEQEHPSHEGDEHGPEHGGYEYEPDGLEDHHEQ